MSALSKAHLSTIQWRLAPFEGSIHASWLKKIDQMHFSLKQYYSHSILNEYSLQRIANGTFSKKGVSNFSTLALLLAMSRTHSSQAARPASIPSSKVDIHKHCEGHTERFLMNSAASVSIIEFLMPFGYDNLPRSRPYVNRSRPIKLNLPR